MRDWCIHWEDEDRHPPDGGGGGAAETTLVNRFGIVYGLRSE